MKKSIVQLISLMMLLTSADVPAQTRTQPTPKQSVEQLKQDFKNLKDVFKKKEKADTSGTANEEEATAANNGVSVAVGSYHVLALKNGTLYGWGDNAEGQLGLGTKSVEYTPRQVGNTNEWKYIDAAAMHSLGIKKDGSLWAWGWGNSHEMGLGQKNSRSLVPARVGGDTSWVMVSTAQDNTVALKRDGSLWVWGNNVQAALGVGPTINSAVYVPTRVGKHNDWQTAAAAQHIILAIKKNGTLWSWGRKGRIDVRGINGLPDVTTAPIQVGTANDWSRLFVHKKHGLAAIIGEKQDGSIWVWGSNHSGKLGVGDELVLPEPTRINLNGKWNTFSIANDYSIAVHNNGSLWHSGSFLKWTDAKIGQQNSSKTFTRMNLPGKWNAAHTLQNSAVILVNDQGDIYAYGINARGETGQGTKGGSWKPLPVKL